MLDKIQDNGNVLFDLVVCNSVFPYISDWLELEIVLPLLADILGLGHHTWLKKNDCI